MISKAAFIAMPVSREHSGRSEMVGEVQGLTHGACARVAQGQHFHRHRAFALSGIIVGLDVDAWVAVFWCRHCGLSIGLRLAIVVPASLPVLYLLSFSRGPVA